MIRDKHILVAVLNWGLGHATRSIPIIHQLISQNNHISVASDGAALDLLRSTFPDLPSLALPGYDITYPTSSMAWNIGSQLWKIQRAIHNEHSTVSQWIQENKTDILISDNRYGCHHAETHNILISHQLNLQVPFGSSIINRMHAQKLSRFDEIWVPDDIERTLSGNLSAPKWLKTSAPIKYIGAQSRIEKVSPYPSYDIAAILSGPEPQRTFLEHRLIKELSTMDKKSILIQGSKSAQEIPSMDNVTVIPFADQTLLSEIFNGSQLIVCRSGYSTIMDLAKVKGHALFIPTPGQTEQIYLAQSLEEKGIAQYQHQKQINLSKAWNNKGDYSGF